MYEYFVDGDLTGCIFTAGNGVRYTGMVVTGEYEEEYLARDAAHKMADSMFNNDK